MKSKFLLGFYIVALIHHLFTIYIGLSMDYSKGKTQAVRNIGTFSLRFITSWNFILQTIYIMLALTQEYKKENNNMNENDKWWKRRGFVFNSLVLPITIVVSTGFWFIYYYSREAVMPTGILDIVPYWLNYNIHTHILVLPVVELLCHNLLIPSMNKSLITFSILSQIYITVFFASYFEKKQWMYPVYNNLSWIERITYTQMIFGFAVIIWYLAYRVQQTIQNFKINRGYFTKKIS